MARGEQGVDLLQDARDGPQAPAASRCEPRAGPTSLSQARLSPGLPQPAPPLGLPGWRPEARTEHISRGLTPSAFRAPWASLYGVHPSMARERSWSFKRGHPGERNPPHWQCVCANTHPSGGGEGLATTTTGSNDENAHASQKAHSIWTSC